VRPGYSAPHSGGGSRERLLVYVAAALAAALLVGRARQRTLLSRLLAGIATVASYSLVARLFPARLGSVDAIAGYRLNRPRW